MTLSRPLPYLLHVAPSKKDDDTLERGTPPTLHPPGTTLWRKAGGARLPSHLRSCVAIPAAVLPSQALQRHPSIVGDIATPTAVRPPIFRQLSPQTGVRTTTKQELKRYYPRSRPWTGTGFTTTPARGKIRQDDCQFHDIVRHAAACST
jgi:hypothetical protein